MRCPGLGGKAGRRSFSRSGSFRMTSSPESESDESPTQDSGLSTQDFFSPPYTLITSLTSSSSAAAARSRVSHETPKKTSVESTSATPEATPGRSATTL